MMIVGGAATPPERGSENTAAFASMVDSELLRQLDLAQLELDRGNPDRARAHATLASLPQALTFYLDTGGYSDRRAAELAEWAREAIEAWNAAGPCIFSESETRGVADVVISFRERVNGGRNAGYVTARRSARYGANGYTASLSAFVEISNRIPGGRLMGRCQVRKAVAHELGHVLGLEDSSSLGNVMGPVPTWDTELTVDTRAIQALEELDARAKAYLAATQRATAVCEVPKAFNFLEPR
jgi:hypothetical protein